MQAGSQLDLFSFCISAECLYSLCGRSAQYKYSLNANMLYIATCYIVRVSVTFSYVQLQSCHGQCWTGAMPFNLSTEPIWQALLFFAQCTTNVL